MELGNKNMFTCTCEPRWNKASFTIRRQAKDEKAALKFALKFKQFSGGFNNYSNFRYEGKLIETKGLVLLKTGKITKGKIDERGKLIK